MTMTVNLIFFIFIVIEYSKWCKNDNLWKNMKKSILYSVIKERWKYHEKNVFYDV